MKINFTFTILLSMLVFACGGEETKSEPKVIPALDATFDPVLAHKGEELFKKKCYSCHREEHKMIGPAMKGITERRAPEWIIKMILQPDVMIKEDSIAKSLLKEYGSPMTNMHLSEYEARLVYEYLRRLK